MWHVWSCSGVLLENRPIGKLEPVISAANEVTEDENKSQSKCNFCGGTNMGSSIWQCQGCKAVKYCNKRFQKQHWSEHKKLCCSIQDLSKAEEDSSSGHFMSHLTPMQHSEITNLVGNHCTVNCQSGGKTTKALWETGAQVSLVSKKFLREMFPNTEIKDTSELIEAELNITAVNGEAISYIGWVQLNFQLSQGQPLLQIPFLVTEKHLTCY